MRSVDLSNRTKTLDLICSSSIFEPPRSEDGHNLDNSFKRLVKWTEALGKSFWLDFPIIKFYFPNDRVRLELLYQDASFQIERVSVEPFSRVPVHRHLKVDSCEFHLAGEGTVILGRHEMFVGKDAAFRPIVVSHNTWHGGWNEKFVQFLSVQYWLKAPIGPISSDWQGRDTPAQIEELNG
jgi:mannose-6-phosphate isomerase-like protein (cupin superfamily)